MNGFINFVFYELKASSGQSKDQAFTARQKEVVYLWMSDAPVKVLNNQSEKNKQTKCDPNIWRANLVL